MASFCNTLFYITFITILAGCATTRITEGPAPGVRVESTSLYSANIRMNSVVILDRNLQKWYVFENTLTGSIERGKKGKIAVESTGARRTQTGTLEAWTTLRNRTNYPLQIEARAQFFDSNKVPLEGPTSWQRLMLPANSVISYSEVSTNVSDVTYYYIEVQEGR